MVSNCIKGAGRMADRKKKHSKGKKSVLITIMGMFAVICLTGYALWTIISQQTEIAQLEKETEELSDKITVAKQQNDEYTRLLSENDEDAYMEQIAIGKLGYAYPDEKRFFIISGD